MSDETGGALGASTLLPSPPTRQYLEQTVYPALFRALCAADRARPTDVAGFLAQQLRAPAEPDAPAPEPEEDQDPASAREPVAVSDGGDVVSLFSFYDTKGTRSLPPRVGPGSVDIVATYYLRALLQLRRFWWPR
eukprot:COSAG02_NODE_5563_length_4227_cov_3.175630_2_plen_135_part_00